MPEVRLAKLSDCLVFLDFDNTITPFDVLDGIIERFSVDKKWIAYEQAWKKGKIGSRLCLEGQLRSVRVSRKELLRYLSKIKLDPQFADLYAILKREGMQPVILSDNFTFIVKFLLLRNGINGAPVYANTLKFCGDKLIPAFPYVNRRCRKCAHCKKKNLLKKDVRGKLIMYIGDGLSDVCPAENSDIVFAKGRLLDYFRKTRRLCLAFNTLEDIHNYLRGLEK
jgi:2,3-diketo-5-methylthio-1-phosphopentane phosphatase